MKLGFRCLGCSHCPSLTHSFLASFLSSLPHIPSFLPSWLYFFTPSLLPSFLHSFLPSFLRGFTSSIPHSTGLPHSPKDSALPGIIRLCVCDAVSGDHYCVLHHRIPPCCGCGLGFSRTWIKRLAEWYVLKEGRKEVGNKEGRKGRKGERNGPRSLFHQSISSFFALVSSPLFPNFLLCCIAQRAPSRRPRQQS